VVDGHAVRIASGTSVPFAAVPNLSVGD